ncbi:MAG: transglutaminaseTgpA domain-containing protein [Acidobacteriota bacterium]
MSFDREKRTLLGYLALLAAVPLPFNQAVQWWYLGLFAIAVIYFIQRVEQGLPTVLPMWALNMLGLIYMPIFLSDVWLGIRRGSFIEALLRLLLFLLAVKLWALRREREKWHVMIAVFFVFAASMATSSHLTIALYLVAFISLAIYTLLRFAHWYLEAGFGDGSKRKRSSAPAPRPRKVSWTVPLTVGTLLVLMVSVPIFALMPRVRDPFIFGRGVSAGDTLRTTGFSDSVDLELTTSIRGNRQIVMRVRYEDPSARPAELRFKGAAYDRYENRRWHRLPEAGATQRSTDGVFVFADDVSARTTVEIFQEPMASRALLLPLETVRLGPVPLPRIEKDGGGALILPMQPSEMISFEVAVADTAVLRPVGFEGALDLTGITPRVAELATEVAGEGSDAEKIVAIERHLLGEYGYTLDFVGRSGQQPIEEFLFEYGSGHCELFASSMVLMLRSQGIPARLVTGFLGGERNPLEGYIAVRQDNAHAWVEAYAPSTGWRSYDPTPPEGRPGEGGRDLLSLIPQVWDYLMFRWDRWVLSYGAEDQQGIVESLRERIAGWWSDFAAWLEGEEAPESPMPGGEGPELASPPTDRQTMTARGVAVVILVAMAVSAAVALIVWWLRRRPPTAADGYRILREQLRALGAEIPTSLGPRAVENVALETLPSAASAVRRLTALYLDESFADRPIEEAARVELDDARRQIAQAVREELRERRRARRPWARRPKPSPAG